MYYLSLNDICTAFNTLRKQIDNRLIGILGVLQAIDTRVEDNHTYEVQDERIARWYDKVLYFSDDFEEVSTARTHFVKFSKQWKNFVANSFLKETPNIYHLISVVYFYYGWKNKPTHEELLSRFIADFHIDEEAIKQMFDTSKLPLFFEDSLEPKRVELKSKLGLTGETFSFDIRGGSIQARPSQLSRAPFFQTLYSGIECLECLLISNKDIEELYPTSRQFLYTSYQYFQKIFFGTPGSGKSHNVKELTKGKKVHRTTFHPDSDYASFVGCYKPIMKTSVQDILSLDELIQRIPEVQDEDNAIGKFTIKYYRSIQKLQETPDKQDLRKRIQEAKGASSDGVSQYAYMNQAISLGIYLNKEGLWRDNSTISYSFIPQVFTEAYVEAWKKLNPDDAANSEIVYLVIEEINRGNCAQIFGDLFQLLDRNESGYSDYHIKADSDLRDYLYSQLGEEHEGIKGGDLRLPPNLRILATMNTSDQSLFPMDSAFKRRWDWEYVPVDYSDSVPSGRFIITLGGKKYRWVKFLQAVNTRIRKATDSEDKQMGNFFIKSDVSEAEFKSKVMFYLWNEVCRDEYGTQNNFFRSKQNDEEFEFSFNDLYQTDGLDKLHGFMDYLGVECTTEE
ncbi:MAG: AAA family ATPase [Bacteroides thetaiotaomicron]